MKKDLRIVYMGTPEFAVPSLNILVENGYNVVGVITAPDKPSGRGLKVNMSAVKEAALKHNIPVLQPDKLKNPEFLEDLKTLNANLQIVVAFRMLPEVVWDMPEIGTFNLHASLLPQYRGAAPINWAVMNGETETGCTTFFLQHEIDTGDIILQHKEPILPEDNVGTLYERLMNNGAQLVLKTVQKIENDEVSLQPQNESQELKSAPKIFRDTCKIDWSKTSEEIHNHVRGLCPHPVAWTELQGKTCKIYKSQPNYAECKQAVESDGKTYLRFKTADGSLDILELKLEGKKRMFIEDFLRGFNLNQTHVI